MGEAAAREQFRDHIVDFINSQPKEQRKNPKLNFDVFITSYDLAIKDAEFLQKFDWKYLIVVCLSSMFERTLTRRRTKHIA